MDGHDVSILFTDIGGWRGGHLDALVTLEPFSLARASSAKGRD
jgi:hypothetical protein